VGPLEVLLDTPSGAPRAAVVFAHPLPTQGGTMHTKVVYQCAKALRRIGCVVLRFNFRGVGRSAGSWDEGRGEMDDYRAALDYMAGRYPGVELWAAGFSCGSYVAWSVGAQDDRVCTLIGIAQPKMTSSISDGDSPGARRSASTITAAAMSSGRTVRSAPLGALPTAVRVAATITASCM
jgi:alpha/beta superfamily hydrolase